MPEWYSDQPSELYNEQFYFAAFGDLSSCRVNGMSLGPIPWTAIDQYSKHRKLSDDVSEHLNIVIREMDAVYLDWQEEQCKRNQPNE